MKKIITIVIVIAIISSVIISNQQKNETKLNINTEKVQAKITEYYIYGTKLNLKGQIPITEYKDIKLLLYNEQEQVKEIKLITKKEEDYVTFSIEEEINNGLYLDNISRGTYYFFLEIINDDIKYYSLSNDTTYDHINYYTLSKYNNYISVDFNNKHKTLMLNITENKKEEVYDITIDAGHGGKDSGAVGNGYYEKNIALDVALDLQKELTRRGLKVAITRTTDIMLEEYNIEKDIGRAVIAQQNNSKYLFSIHLNSHNQKGMNGVEILTPPNIDYTFARNLAQNIVEKTKTSYSNNLGFKMYNGVYTRIINQAEIDSRNESNENPYDIKLGTSYYYMLREPGGYMTGAYVDGRDKEVGENPYYDSNKGVESYIIELGYIINKIDITNITKNQKLYVIAIADTIIDKLIK